MISAMLEQTVLMLGPMTPAGRRDIFGVIGTLVGFAQWREPSRSWWNRLLARRVMEVREIEDASLLLTVQRALTLLPGHDVQDADGAFVGRVAGAAILDAQLVRWATYFDHELFGRSFVSVAGHGLALAQRTEKGMLLNFAEEVQSHPFHKMLILAALLLG
jgi:hypothetical protein